MDYGSNLSNVPLIQTSGYFLKISFLPTPWVSGVDEFYSIW